MGESHAMIVNTSRNYTFAAILGSIAVSLVLLLPNVSLADTRGKISGQIVDNAKQGVLGANVMIVGTTLGAAADPQGYYAILNIPVGMYDIRVSAVGYQTNIIRGVRVESGQTATVNVTVAEAVIEAGEVTSVAERPLVDRRQTSSVAILSKDDIEMLPVQSLNDVVNLQAGVVDGHFRGGRAGEVQYQVEGVSVNNPFDNSPVLELDRSVLQEVQVISGTFDAEYGQAMSGVVNAILRSGSEERFEGSLELYTGEYFPGNTADFPQADGSFPPAIGNATLTLSGPTGLSGTSFLVNIRRFVDDGALYGTRRFVPTDTSDFSARVFRPTGDSEAVSMSQYEEWSGHLKIATRLLQDVQLSYQLIGNLSQNLANSFQYRFNPDGMRTQERRALVHGLDWTHTLSPTTFYTVSLRQNYFSYSDLAFGSALDERYYEAGAPRGDVNYELGATIQGYDIGRYEQKTNAFVVKGTLTSQVSQAHLLKVGGEFQYADVGFGAPGTLSYEILSGTASRVYIVADSLAQNTKRYFPTTFALFAQDRIEVADFLIRVGLRAEYYDANSTVPSDPANPANSIPGAPESVPQQTTRKFVVAPRFGMSYPITATGALYFSYGHFYQMPGFGNLYANSDYSILKNLQEGGVSYGVMGNPDIRPEFTVQYEFGFKQEFARMLGVDLSVFYKDVRDLLGVELIDTYADATYARFTNVDFGSIYGIKATVDYRLSSALSFSLNYTFMDAVGNSSDPTETANRAAAGEDPRPRQIPFDWDQSHTLNFAATLYEQNDYSVTAILKYGDGSPYTPSIGSGFGASLERNSSAKPVWALVDVRAEKFFSIDPVQLSVCLRIFNLFDTRFTNGFVFTSTGTVFYSLNPAADAEALINPGRYAQPRRIELGIRIQL
jgi:outer membrane receptor protein involved in Fe transport